jgi:hypothetical protein
MRRRIPESPELKWWSDLSMAKRRAYRHQNEMVEPPAGDAASDLYPQRSLGTQWISDDLLEDTRRVWSKQYGRPISPEEAIEICMNVKRFAELLVAIKRENEAKAEA